MNLVVTLPSLFRRPMTLTLSLYHLPAANQTFFIARGKHSEADIQGAKAEAGTGSNFDPSDSLTTLQ